MFRIYYDDPDLPVSKPCKVALKHMFLFETHHASTVFANGGGVAPPHPPKCPTFLSRASLIPSL